MLHHAGSNVTAVVVEVQLRRDKNKHWTWPVYLASLRARYRCPTILLVVCLDRRTAEWCAARPHRHREGDYSGAMTH
jgi:hypothetical protein